MQSLHGGVPRTIGAPNAFFEKGSQFSVCDQSKKCRYQICRDMHCPDLKDQPRADHRQKQRDHHNQASGMAHIGVYCAQRGENGKQYFLRFALRGICLQKAQQYQPRHHHQHIIRPPINAVQKCCRYTGTGQREGKRLVF